jgi:hypothetical protein
VVSRRKAKKRKVNHTPSTPDGPVAAPPRGGEVVVRPQARPTHGFTYLDDGEPVPPLRIAEAYMQLAQVALGRVRFYGQALAEAYGERGMDAFWEDSYATGPGEDAEPYKVGEYIKALVQLESGERDRAERLLTSALRIGVEARNEDMRRDQVATMVGALRNLASMAKLPLDDSTRRMMQQAIIDARRSVLAHDSGR